MSKAWLIHQYIKRNIDNARQGRYIDLDTMQIGYSAWDTTFQDTVPASDYPLAKAYDDPTISFNLLRMYGLYWPDDYEMK